MTTPNLTWIETSSGARPDHGPFIIQTVSGLYIVSSDVIGMPENHYVRWAYFNPPESEEDRAWRDFLIGQPPHTPERAFRAGYRAGGGK